MTLYLASASQTRRKLLRELGISFRTYRPRVREDKPLRGRYAYSAMENARKKVSYVMRRLKSGVVIGADTFAVSEGRVLGKPRSFRHARQILMSLSGRSHVLYTGVCAGDAKTGKISTAYARTRVFLRKLTDEDIDWMYEKVYPLDKAPAYTIEGRGAAIVERIEGCYYNVMGLPVVTAAKALEKIGHDIKEFT